MNKGLTIIGVVAIVVGGIVAIILGMHTINQVGKGFIKAGDTAIEIAEAFQKGTIETIWKDYITKVSGSNYLQVAKLNSVETFTRTDSKTIMWDMIGLPDVIVQLEAPVEFTFYLNLNDQWQFSWNEADHGIMILAPEIQYNQPAVDISNMSFTTTKGSILRSEKKVQDQFIQDVTEVLFERAGEKTTLIREIARSETSKFASNWFINLVFKDSNVKPYVKGVYFADEQLSDSALKELSNAENQEKL